MNRNISPIDVSNWEEEIIFNGQITPYQLLGFIEGDGSFMVMGQASCLSISQHTSGQSALELIEKYFNSILKLGLFQYKFDLTNLEKPNVQKSS